jgi:hypothetical protein
MGGMEVNIQVGSASINIAELLSDNARWVVKHSPGCCSPCRNNEDPAQIPFPGCRSNFRRGGNGCRCTVEFDEGED